MATLNPIVSTSLNLESPVQPVDVGGAMSGLFRQFAGAFAEANKPVEKSADERKMEALSPFYSRMNELHSMDLPPSQLTSEVNKLIRQQLTATPQYRTDIFEGAGAGYGADPAATDPQVLRAQALSEYAETAQGKQDLFLSIQRTPDGAIDQAATDREFNRRAFDNISRQAEIERVSEDLQLMKDRGESTNQYTANWLNTTFLPEKTAYTRAMLDKTVETVLMDSVTPMDQAEAIGELNNMRANLVEQYRAEALSMGHSAEVVNQRIAEAVAPIDSLLSSIEGNQKAYTATLSAYEAALKHDALEFMTDALGPLAAFPEARESFMVVVGRTAWTNNEEVESAIKTMTQRAMSGHVTPFNLFPSFEDPSVSAASGEAVVSEEAVSVVESGLKDGSIDPVEQMKLSVNIIENADVGSPGGIDAITTEVGNLIVLGRASNAPYDYATLQKVFSGQSLRNIVNATTRGGEGAYELRSALAGFIGGQITRQSQRIENLGFSIGWEENGTAYLIGPDGVKRPQLTNPQGAEKKAFDLLKNINLMGNALVRVNGLQEPVFRGLSIVPGTIKEGEIEEYLSGKGGDEELGGGSGTDRISSKDGDTTRAIAASFAQEYGIPQDLFFRLVGQESSWAHVGADGAITESPKGALGLGQLMPDTARMLGVDPSDPVDNLRGSAMYLSQMYAKFGSWPLALAAYNAGPGAVEEHGGIPPFAETQNYVANIMAGGDEYRGYAYVDQFYEPVGVPQGVVLNPDMAPLVSSLDGASSMTQPYAVAHMDYVLNGPFQTMQELFGSAITINDGIAKEGTSREGSTPGSQHFHGNALDLSTAGMNDEQKINLFKAALAAGFTGFGFGNGILHVDIGPKRSWAYGNDTFGGLPIADLQNMVASGAGPQLRVAASTSSGSGWVEGEDRDVGEWRPDSDPGEGAPSNFVPIKGGAPETSPRPAERPVSDGTDGASSGKPRASEKATQELSERSKALLMKLGRDPSEVAGVFKTEEEVRQAVDRGDIENGAIVEVNGTIMVAQ